MLQKGSNFLINQHFQSLKCQRTGAQKPIKCHSATQVSTKEGSLKHWIWNSVSRGACWCPPLGNGEFQRTGGREQRAKGPSAITICKAGCVFRQEPRNGRTRSAQNAERDETAAHTWSPGSRPRGGRSKCSHGQLLTASLTCSFTSLKCSSFVSFLSNFSMPASLGAAR